MAGPGSANAGGAFSPGAGSSTLDTTSRPVIDRVDSSISGHPEGLFVAGSEPAVGGVGGVGGGSPTTSQVLESGPLPVYVDNGSQVIASGEGIVVDGATASLTASTLTPTDTITLGEATGPVATGSITLRDGSTIELQVTLVPVSMLLITTSGYGPDLPLEEISLGGLALAGKELNVSAQQLKGVVVRKR